MPHGLVTTTDMAGADYAASTNQDGTGSLETSVEFSHLDSFFASSGWTREDVLMMVGFIQVLAWLALLYLEVSDR